MSRPRAIGSVSSRSVVVRSSFIVVLGAGGERELEEVACDPSQDHPLDAGEILQKTAGSGPLVLGFHRRSTPADDMATTASRPYGVVSGIAKPAEFENACRDLVGHTPRVAVRFDDHIAYRAEHLPEIVAAGAGEAVERWLTTAKDHVKLAGIWPDEKSRKPKVFSKTQDAGLAMAVQGLPDGNALNLMKPMQIVLGGWPGGTGPPRFGKKSEPFRVLKKLRE